MGIKVQNSRLELNIASYENNSNKIAYFSDHLNLNFANENEILPYIVLNDIVTGMELSSYLNYIIIANGYFYDKEENKVYSFDKPYTLMIDTSVNSSYNVYYIFSNNSFIYSNAEPQEKYKLLGSFEVLNNKITSIFPLKDLASFYEDRFIIKENLNTIGYRLYSDGWKEQWGNNANPTFPIAFNNIPVNVTAGATNVTTTGMTISAGYWYACGY